MIDWYSRCIGWELDDTLATPIGYSGVTDSLVSLRTDIPAESGYFPRYWLAEDKVR